MRAGAAFMEVNPRKFYYASYNDLATVAGVRALPPPPTPYLYLTQKFVKFVKYAYFPIRKIRLFVLSKIRLFLPLSKYCNEYPSILTV